jgi:hypothetical protein
LKELDVGRLDAQAVGFHDGNVLFWKSFDAQVSQVSHLIEGMLAAEFTFGKVAASFALRDIKVQVRVGQWSE